ncbi:MAG TPA: hypothetical protein ENH09_05210 [Bacteroidetes bacterium]|nr:hypothetical protein [Bacteroidota bacterium]
MQKLNVAFNNHCIHKIFRASCSSCPFYFSVQAGRFTAAKKLLLLKQALSREVLRARRGVDFSFWVKDFTAMTPERRGHNRCYRWLMGIKGLL